MDYSWNVADLKKIIRYLKRKAKLSTSNKEKEIIFIDIKFLEDVIKGISSTGVVEIYETPSLEKLLKEENDKLFPFSYLWEDCIKFSDKATFRGSCFDNSKKYDFSKDDLLEIVYDFYNETLNADLKPIFLNDFNRRKDHVRFVSPNPNRIGQTTHIYTLKETFIETQYKQSFEDIVTLIHEYGHGIHFHLNFIQQMSSVYMPIQELLSLFMEFLSYDYFLNIEEFKRSSQETKIDMWEELSRESTTLALDIKALKNGLLLTKNNFKGTKNKLSDSLHVAKNTLHEALSIYPSDYLPYVFSTIIAIELVTIYKKDRDKAFYLLKRIIEYPKSMKDLYYFIHELGIIPNKNVLQYENNLKRELKK